MIELAQLTEADRSRIVRYRAHGQIEYGRITSWNDEFVFVRYHLVVYADGREQPRGGMTSEATRPEDLEFC